LNPQPMDARRSEPGTGPGRPGADWLDGLKQGFLIGSAVIALVLPPMAASRLAPSQAANAAAAAKPVAVHVPRDADFGGEQASPEAQRIAQWVAQSGDNKNMFFVILDKKNAKVFVFEPTAKLQAASPVLLGLAQGDDSVDGIGQKTLAEVRPEERTTPAGRFIAEPGRNVTGEDVVWVDYDAAVSMHRVRQLEAKERRLERLASPTADDNRISYGCINVPVDFYENFIRPAFKGSNGEGRYGVVYVLPETKPLQDVFAAAFAPVRAHAKM
jgi:hypothetical protein